MKKDRDFCGTGGLSLFWCGGWGVEVYVGDGAEVVLELSAGLSLWVLALGLVLVLALLDTLQSYLPYLATGLREKLRKVSLKIDSL